MPELQLRAAFRRGRTGTSARERLCAVDGAGVLGAALRRLRTDAGLTQVTLAEAIKISNSSISEIERGERASPDRETVVAWAEHCSALLLGGVSAEERKAEIVRLLEAIQTFRLHGVSTRAGGADTSPAEPGPIGPGASRATGLRTPAGRPADTATSGPALVVGSGSAARPVIAARVREVADVLRELHDGRDQQVRVLLDPRRADLDAAVRELANDGDGAVVLHVLGDGRRGRTSGALYLALDAAATAESAMEIDGVIRLVDDGDGPPFLLLLDISCTPVPSLWAISRLGASAKAHVLGVVVPEDSGLAGLFSQVVATVLRRLHEGELPVDPASRFVPIDHLHTAVRRELNRVAGGSGFAPHFLVQALPDDTGAAAGFFVNRRYTPDLAARSRLLQDDAFRPILEELSGAVLALDPAHYVGKAQAREGLDDANRPSFFRGREPELAELAQWIDEPVVTGSLRVVTGQPGAGKSALLGVLVCAAHPQLADLLPHVLALPVQQLFAAVHARGRTLMELVRGIGEQLGLAPGPATATADWLVSALSRRSSTDPVPTIVLDALDEARAPTDLIHLLLLKLSSLKLADDPNRSACRLLVGTRPWPEFAPLLTAPEAQVCDLDAIPLERVRADVEAFLRVRLVSPLPRGGETELPLGRANTVARQTAAVLTDPTADPTLRGGPFLVASLYAHHLMSGPTEHRPVPRDLGEVLELELAALATDRLIRPVLLALAYAEEPGLPDHLLPSTVAQLIAERDTDDPNTEPEHWRIAQVLGKVAFYLRTRPGTDGPTGYRLFHQALNDHLRRHPFGPAVESRTAIAQAVFRGLLRSLQPSPDGAPRWDAAGAYLRRAAVNHAIDAGRLDELLTDLEFLVYAEPTTLLPALGLAKTPAGRQMAAVYRASAGRHTNERPGRRRQRLSLDAARFQLAAESTRLSSPAEVPLAAWSPVWSTSAQVDPALLTTIEFGGWTRAIALTSLWERSIAVIADPRHDLTLWDLAAGEKVGAPMRGHTDVVRAIDAGRIAGRWWACSTADDGGVRIWDLSSGEQVASAALDALPRGDAVALGDGVVLAGGQDGVLRIVEWGSGELRELRAHDGAISAVVAADLVDGPIAVTAGRDHAAMIWRYRSSESPTVLGGHTSWVSAIAVAPLDDKTVVLTGGSDEVVRVFDATTGDLLHELVGPIGSVSAVAAGVIEGSTMVIACGSSGAVCCWDLASPDADPVLLAGHTGPVSIVQIGAINDRPIAVTGGEDAVRVWDLSSTSPDRPVSRAGHRSDVRALAIVEMASGEVVASGDDDGTVLLWQLSDGSPAGRFEAGELGVAPPAAFGAGGPNIGALAAVPGQPSLLIGRSDGTLALLNVSSGAIEWTIGAHDGPISAVVTATVDNAQYAISAGDDAVIRRWLVPTGELMDEIEGHGDWVNALHVHDDIFVSGGNDGAIMIWRLRDGAQLGPALHVDEDTINCVAVADLPPDADPAFARPIAVGSGDDGMLGFWDVASGTRIRSIAAARQPVDAIAVHSSDIGPLVVTGGQDSELRTWSLSDGRALGTRQLSDAVRCLRPASERRLVVAFGWEVAVLR